MTVREMGKKIKMENSRSTGRVPGFMGKWDIGGDDLNVREFITETWQENFSGRYLFKIEITLLHVFFYAGEDLVK